MTSLLHNTPHPRVMNLFSHHEVNGLLTYHHSWTQTYPDFLQKQGLRGVRGGQGVVPARMADFLLQQVVRVVEAALVARLSL